MSGALRADINSRASEMDVFRRLQERVSEVEALKKAHAELVQRHENEMSRLQAEMGKAMEKLEAQRDTHIDFHHLTVSELRDVIAVLTSDSGAVVDEIRRAYVCGVRSPEKLRPPLLCEPTFRAPTECPHLMAEAELGSYEYTKLKKVLSAAGSTMPGDQTIQDIIRTTTQRVYTSLQATDSPGTEAECIALMRELMKFVLALREKVSWGDYVRPSQQHVEGPDVSAYSKLIDLDSSLSKSEQHELEELAKQQDQIDDPMGCQGFAAARETASALRSAKFDEQIREVEQVHIVAMERWQAAINHVMEDIRNTKTTQCTDYDMSIAKNEAALVELKGELQRVLSKVTDTTKQINDLQVEKVEVEQSLLVDEKVCREMNTMVLERIDKLQGYVQTLRLRKAAVATVGDMEQAVLTHIQDLLLGRGRELFEGKSPMLMRQFEVLPNVYCQCALLEDL